MSIIIEPIAFFQTNYAWLIYDDATKNAVVIDPGDAKNVIKFIKDRRLSLHSILITHFHSDHTGGIEVLKEQFNCKVIAPLKEDNKIPGIDQTVKGGDVISLDIGEVRVLETPGHTLGSICYYIPQLKAVFTGDTLFSLGCGRLFEGGPEQMYVSLQRLAMLPGDTLVYCAHEYTQDNGSFALTVEPHNGALKKRVEQVNQLRQQGLPTLPVLLSTEKQTNPFLLAKDVAQFTEWRTAKDHFV